MNWDLYPNFSEEEFKCSHTGLCKMDAAFMEILQKIRTEYGKPMTVTSGYRHKTHPIELRKSRPGEHTLGTCADIALQGSDAVELMKVALDLGVTRIGVSQKGSGRFLHLGIGGGNLPNPWMWSY
jgi:zinc D-Ala-D-Ala carboxypeptidase